MKTAWALCAIAVANERCAAHNSTATAGTWHTQVLTDDTCVSMGSGTVADIDGDGELDVVSACQDNDRVVWHVNRGGQLGISGTPVFDYKSPVFITKARLRYIYIYIGYSGVEARPPRAKVALPYQ